MTFGELLKKQRQKSLEKSFARRRETFEKMGGELIDDGVRAVRESCISAAENGGERLAGYISEYQRGEKILPTVADFNSGEVFRAYSGGAYVMQNYGTDGEFAEYIRRGIEKELRALGLTVSEVRAEKRMFFSLSKDDGKPSGAERMTMAQDGEKYVMYISVRW